jgi:hypothetical protein
MTFSRTELNIGIPDIALKTSLGFETNDTVLVYSGNLLYRWQCFQETVEIAERIIAKLPGVKLLVLTRPDDIDYAVTTLTSSCIDNQNFRVRNVEFSDINLYLNISSFGFALRHCDEMNHCTPAAKILEYAAVGVVPITSMAMGRYGEELRDLGFDTIVDDVENINDEWMNRLLSLIERPISSESKKVLADWAFQYSYEYTEISYIEELRNAQIL